LSSSVIYKTTRETKSANSLLVIFQNPGIFSSTAKETYICGGSSNGGLATDDGFLCYEW
jgi:hypothetical protein